MTSLVWFFLKQYEGNVERIMQKIEYNQRRKHISKLLIPVKPCLFYQMPANIVCAEMCSLTPTKLSASCLRFCTNGLCWYEGLQKQNIFKWMPSAPAHGDELPGTLTRSGGDFSESDTQAAPNTYIGSACRDVLQHLPVEGIMIKLWRLFSKQCPNFFKHFSSWICTLVKAIHLLFTNFGVSHRKKNKKRINSHSCAHLSCFFCCHWAVNTNIRKEAG